MTQMRCPLNEAADISPHEAALIREEGELTYSEYEALVSGCAAHLRRLGLGPGDRVGLAVHESWQIAVLVFALLRCRAVICPLPGRTARAWMGALGIRHVVADGGRIEEGMEARVKRWSPEEVIPSFYEGQDRRDQAMLEMDQPATILPRRPRVGGGEAILHSFGNYYYGARGVNHAVRLSSGGRWLFTGSMDTAGGWHALFQCILGGAALVLRSGRPPDPAGLRQDRITHLTISVSELERFVEVPAAGEEPSNLRAVIVRDGQQASEWMDRARHAGWPVCASWDIPEAASATTLAAPMAAPAEREGSGPALKYRRVRIGGNGHILVGGATLFGGYVEGPVVRRPVDGEGWFDTGQLGRLDEGNCLHVAIRKPPARASTKRRKSGEGTP